MNQALTLNATALRNRVAELGLRQWWLAEQLGVDRRTVLRWINGQVRQISPERAQALAGVLGCRVQALLLHDTHGQLASAEDQRAAGAALAASRLVEQLAPVGEWHVIEQLVKATAMPDLPVQVLGRLYHQLSVACWRQDKLDEAARHNASAWALAERCGDQALRADVLGSRANLCFWAGDLPGALACWREALGLARWLTPRQRGALHSNLGGALIETGSHAEGRREVQAALECFDRDGAPMNHSIAHAHLALLALERGEEDEAEQQAALAEGWARRDGYRRGLALAALLRAQASARRGDLPGTAAALAQGLADFDAQGIAESVNHRLAARAWRRLGELARAQQALDEAGRLAARFPFEARAVAAEQALVAAGHTGAGAPGVSPRVTGQGADAPLP